MKTQHLSAHPINDRLLMSATKLFITELRTVLLDHPDSPLNDLIDENTRIIIDSFSL